MSHLPKLLGLVALLPLTAGCFARTAPFDQLDRAPVTVLRLSSSQQPAPSQEHAPKIDTPYVISGATLFVVGMAMATYGFLHTSGGDFVSGEVSKESKTGLGGAGLAVAAAGGAILYVGAQRAKKAPSLTLAPHRVTISKQLSW